MENYEMLPRIGRGAQGIILRVRNKITGELLAIEFISRGGGNDEDIRREIINHKDLNHPHVIKVKEVVSDENTLGIVMDYAEGGDLSTILTTEGVFRETKARKLFQELIAGVSYIHFKNICHRDLKPENILLDSKGNGKICYFSLSKSSVHHSKPTSSVGTDIYIAPEVYAHPKEYNGKLADVWSCGVVLHFMLTRKYPEIQNGNITAQCMNSLNVSDDGKDLIGCMLATDPAKRITIEEIKKHPWYLRDLPDSLKEEAQAVYISNQYMAGTMHNYELVHRLGGGASWVNFKVRNKMTGEELVMKCILRGYRINKYVQREIMNHRVLQHPNVIKFKEVVLDDMKLGIVMDYAEKTLLEEVLFYGPFTEAKARKMFQMLIAGVSYMHSKNICQRDLNLENILLTNKDVLKICDFGLSKVGSRVTGSTHDGKLEDIWSCGRVLIEMLSTQTLDSLSENIASGCKNMSVSENCRDLIDRMIDPIPEERITIEEIKKHPWYLEDLPVDLTDEAQAVCCCDIYDTVAYQSEEEILEITEQAQISERTDT